MNNASIGPKKNKSKSKFKIDCYSDGHLEEIERHTHTYDRHQNPQALQYCDERSVQTLAASVFETRPSIDWEKSPLRKLAPSSYLLMSSF